MKVKICGIKNIEDAAIINEFLPDYCGFVFAKSKRQVTAEEGVLLSKYIDKRIKTVGVFVNEEIKKTVAIAKQCNLYAIQLHADEDSNYIERIRCLCPELKIIKAVPTKDESTMTKMLSCSADFFLFDAFSKDERGGTGKVANWQLIQSVTAGRKIDFFLAGGIGPENVSQASKLKPYAVDLSSSVEKPQGGKDYNKVKALFSGLEMIK